MNLSNIQDATVRRLDSGTSNVRARIVLNLIVGGTFTTDYFVGDDMAAFKAGTAAEKTALKKKYIRQAIAAYLSSTVPPPVETDMGVQTVAKVDFTDPGDT